jgi:inosose dehydratase
VETPSEVDYLLTHTEPDLLGLCLDTGHFAFGGGDPLAALQRYGDRVRHVHFKDCSPTVARASREEQLDYIESLRRGIFCELGKGNVDFSAILRHLKERHYQGWVVVEQDVLPGMGSPFENARRNRAYLRSIGL